VIEGCSWSNLLPLFIRVVDNVARNGFVLLGTRVSGAEDGSRTRWPFPEVRSTESRIILASLSQYKIRQDSWVSRTIEAIVDRSTI